MSVVSLSEINAYQAHKSLLNDAGDAKKLIDSINSFIDNSSNLKGTGYDLMRNNLGVHVQTCSNRINAANQLYSSICSALSFMSSYMSPYSVLDDSVIDEVKTTIGSLCNEVDNLIYKINSKVSKPKLDSGGGYVCDDNGNVIYQMVYEFSESERDSFLKKVEEIQNKDIPYFMELLEKLEGLEGAISTALGMVSTCETSFNSLKV